MLGPVRPTEPRRGVPGEGVFGFRGDRFRAARRELRLTQTQLAERLNIAQSQVSDWERGTVNPRARNLRAAAEVLGVPVGELLDVDPPPTLRRLRQRAGLSQRDVAARLRVTQQAYHKLEHGTLVLRPEQAAVIAGSLGVAPEEVLAAWRRSR